MRSLTKIQFLLLVALLNQPMHPYAIRQQIIELTSRHFWPSKSNIRVALDSLIKTGLIEECQSDPSYWLVARRSAPYELTDAGYRKVRRELSMYYEVFAKSRIWLERLGDTSVRGVD